MPRFFWPIRNIAERFGTFQAAMASSERIFELLDSETEAAGGSWQSEQVHGEIEFRNVFFAYQEEDWILRDVSCRAAPGQAIALVGATGAGKSTVASLVCRFYDDRISVDRRTNANYASRIAPTLRGSTQGQ